MIYDKKNRAIPCINFVISGKSFATNMQNNNVKEFYVDLLQTNRHPLSRSFKGLQRLLWEMANHEDFKVLGLTPTEKRMFKKSFSKGNGSLFIGFEVIPPLISPEECIAKKISYLGTVKIYFAPHPNEFKGINHKLNLFRNSFSSKLDQMLIPQKWDDLQYTWDGRIKTSGWESEEKQKHLKFVFASEREFKVSYATYKKIESNNMGQNNPEKIFASYDTGSNFFDSFYNQNLPEYKYGTINTEYYFPKTVENIVSKWNIAKNSPATRCYELLVPFITDRGTFIVKEGREVRVERTIGFAKGLEVRNRKSIPAIEENSNQGQDFITNYRYGLVSENKVSVSYNLALQKLLTLQTSLCSDLGSEHSKRISKTLQENAYSMNSSVFPLFIPILNKEKFLNSSYLFREVIQTSHWLHRYSLGHINSAPHFSVIRNIYQIKNNYDPIEDFNKHTESGDNSIYNEHDNQETFHVLRTVLQDFESNIKDYAYFIDLKIILIKVKHSIDLKLEDLQVEQDIPTLQHMSYLISILIEDLRYLVCLLLGKTKMLEKIYSTQSSIVRILFNFNKKDVSLAIQSYTKKNSIPKNQSFKSILLKLFLNVFSERILKREHTDTNYKYFSTDYLNLISLFLLKSPHIGYKLDPMKPSVTKEPISNDGLIMLVFVQIANIISKNSDADLGWIHNYLDPFKQIVGLTCLGDLQFPSQLGDSKFIPLHPNEAKLYRAPSSIHLRSRYEGVVKLFYLPEVSTSPIVNPYQSKCSIAEPIHNRWHYILSCNDEFKLINFNEDDSDHELKEQISGSEGSRVSIKDYSLKAIEKNDLDHLSNYFPRYKTSTDENPSLRAYKKISTELLINRNLLGIELVTYNQDEEPLKPSVYEMVCEKISDSLGFKFVNSDCLSDNSINAFKVLTSNDVNNLTKTIDSLYNDQKIPAQYLILFVFSRKWNDTYKITPEEKMNSYLSNVLFSFSNSPWNTFSSRGFDMKNMSMARLDHTLREKFLRHYRTIEWVSLQMLSEISSRLVSERCLVELFKKSLNIIVEDKDINQTVLPSRVNNLVRSTAKYFEFSHYDCFIGQLESEEINEFNDKFSSQIIRFPSYHLDPELRYPTSVFYRGHISFLRGMLMYGLHFYHVWGQSLSPTLLFLLKNNQLKKNFHWKSSGATLNSFLSIENDLLFLSRSIVRSNLSKQERIHANHYFGNKMMYSIESILSTISSQCILHSRAKLYQYGELKKSSDIISQAIECSFNLFSKLFENTNVLEKDLDAQKTYQSSSAESNSIDKFSLVHKDKKLFLSYIDSMVTRNRWSVLNSLSKVTFGGMRGIQVKETIRMEDRDVYPSYFGRLCLVRSPEGPNVGIVNYTTIYSRLNSLGQLEIPYRTVYQGKVTNNIVYLSLLEEKHYNICFSSELFTKDGSFVSSHVHARRNGKFIHCSASEVTLCELGSSYILSPAAGLIPFVEANDTARVLMGGNMQTQAVELSRPQRPLISSGLEPLLSMMAGNYRQMSIDTSIKPYEAHLSSFILGGKPSLPNSSPEKRHMTDKSKSYNIIETKITDQLYNTICSKQMVSAQSVITNSASNIVKDESISSMVNFSQPFQGEATLGQNVLVGYISAGGNTFEDSILVSDELIHNKVFHHGYIKSFAHDTANSKVMKQQVIQHLKSLATLSLQNVRFASSCYQLIAKHAYFWLESLVSVGDKICPGQIIYQSKMQICISFDLIKSLNKIYAQLYGVLTNLNDYAGKKLLIRDMNLVMIFLWNNLDSNAKQKFFQDNLSSFLKLIIKADTENGLFMEKSELDYLGLDCFMPTLYSKPFTLHNHYYNGERYGEVLKVFEKLPDQQEVSIQRARVSLGLFLETMQQYSIIRSGRIINSILSVNHFTSHIDASENLSEKTLEHFLNIFDITPGDDSFLVDLSDKLHELFINLYKIDSFYYSLVAQIHILMTTTGVHAWKSSTKGGPTFLSADIDSKLVLKVLDEHSDFIKEIYRTLLQNICEFDTSFDFNKNYISSMDLVEKINQQEVICLFNSIFEVWFLKYSLYINTITKSIVSKLVGEKFFPDEKNYFFIMQVIKYVHSTSIFRSNKGEKNGYQIEDDCKVSIYHKMFNEPKNRDLFYDVKKCMQQIDAFAKNFSIVHRTKYRKMTVKKLKQEIFQKLSLASCKNSEIIESILPFFSESLYHRDYNCKFGMEIYEQESLQPGDKLTGRYGNKGVISRIVSRFEMPYMPNGRPLHIALNPLGVTSRMNLGQLLEVQMGLIGGMSSSVLCTKNLIHGFRKNILHIGHMSTNKNTVHRMYAMSTDEVYSKIAEYEAGIRFQMPSYKSIPYAKILQQKSFVHGIDNQFKVLLTDPISGYTSMSGSTVGYMYMFKLEHLATKKISARGGKGKNKMSTGQPVAGKKHHGGQKYGEMEMSCFLAYGASFLVGELLGIKSSSSNIIQSLGKNYNNFHPLTLGQASSTFSQFESELGTLGSHYEIKTSKLKSK